MPVYAGTEAKPAQVEWKDFSTGRALSSAPDVTQLLVNWTNGDKSALDQMTPVLYEELRRLARHFLAAERPGHTLQPTALVHEAYLRLVNQRSADWRNRAQFLGLAASMMRRILINHAEARHAAKRQGDAQRVAVGENPGGSAPMQLDILALNRSLDDLTALDPQQARVVELRYFGGLSIEETAEVIGISPATVKREWVAARLWLLRHMEGEPLQ
jgi:RNA polymerase sigma factor (TIGR02999 family)